MSWEIEYTDQFAEWWNSELNEDEQESITAAVNELAGGGPALGRPFVDSIHTSRHSNMKELRPMTTDIRILFAFDPRRTAILLIGGNKRGDWIGFYERMIPIADRLFDEHIETLRKEKHIP